MSSGSEDGELAGEAKLSDGGQRSSAVPSLNLNVTGGIGTNQGAVPDKAQSMENNPSSVKNEAPEDDLLARTIKRNRDKQRMKREILRRAGVTAYQRGGASSIKQRTYSSSNPLNSPVPVQSNAERGDPIASKETRIQDGRNNKTFVSVWRKKSE